MYVWVPQSFAAATFEGQVWWGMDYKVLLVIAQVLGYATSKFIGIKFISEVRHDRRAAYIIGLLVFAWVCLLGLALLPAPWGIVCMFANGLPLGMIWGWYIVIWKGDGPRRSWLRSCPPV